MLLIHVSVFFVEKLLETIFFIDDFKPASVDTTQDSTVEVGEGHKITVTVPHVEVSQGQGHIDHNLIKIKCLLYLILVGLVCGV